MAPQKWEQTLRRQIRDNHGNGWNVIAQGVGKLALGEFCQAGWFYGCTPTSATAASLHQLAEHHQQSTEEPRCGVAGVAAWW